MSKKNPWSLGTCLICDEEIIYNERDSKEKCDSCGAPFTINPEQQTICVDGEVMHPECLVDLILKAKEHLK